MRSYDTTLTRFEPSSGFPAPLRCLLLPIGLVMATGLLGCSSKSTPSADPNPTSPNLSGLNQAAPTELKGHERAVVALAFSRDGTILASGSADKTVRLWDVATGKERESISHPAGPVYAVAWTAEGKLVTTSDDDRQNGELNWWDPETGVNRKKVAVTNGMVHGLATSPDGEKLAWGKGGTLEVIPSGLADRRPALASYNNQVGNVSYITFSKDGKQLLFICLWGGKLWSIDPVGKPKKIAEPNDPTGVAFDPQGNCLVSSLREVVSVIGPGHGEPDREHQGPAGTGVWSRDHAGWEVHRERGDGRGAFLRPQDP